MYFSSTTNFIRSDMNQLLLFALGRLT